MTRRPVPTNNKKSDEKKSGIDADLVRELASILRDTNLNEIEIEHGELRLRLARGGGAVYAQPQVTHYVEAPAPQAALPAPAAPAPAAGGAPAANHPGAVASPMVGTAYLSPEPGAPVFIKIGDSVTEGQTLMVVEAMKTFNPIPAPRAGKITAILVADAQPVEFGEALVVIE